MYGPADVGDAFVRGLVLGFAWGMVVMVVAVVAL